MTTQEILKNAKAAVPSLAMLKTEKKNEALLAMADALIEHAEGILKANAEDMTAAEGKISEVMLDRLKLNDERIKAMAEGIRDVVSLPDPVGRTLSTISRPNGMTIEKISVPVGVLAIIYESRPNVTSDAAALSLKSGNVCVLRSGKEAFKTANAIIEAMREGLKKTGLPETLINLIQDTTRQSANELMTADNYVDMLIPRGGAGLIRACIENATVPCIQTGTGICHVYVDDSADQDMALKIIDGVPAGDKDFDTEFLDYILAIKVVKNVEEAVAHISAHSTKHSESIVTSTEEHAAYFTALVDSACVYVNTSTRFTDGGEFGLGCEMGISTQKLHARGPMGLNELTTYKYIIRSNGCTR